MLTGVPIILMRLCDKLPYRAQDALREWWAS